MEAAPDKRGRSKRWTSLIHAIPPINSRDSVLDRDAGVKSLVAGPDFQAKFNLDRLDNLVRDAK